MWVGAAVLLTAGCASVQPPASPVQPPVATAPAPSEREAPLRRSRLLLLRLSSRPPPPVIATPAPPTAAAPERPRLHRPSRDHSPAPATPPVPANPAAKPPRRDRGRHPTTARPEVAGIAVTRRQAIGVMTKLTLKNQVDDLLDQFRMYYQGKLKTSLAELRRSYELLVLKVSRCCRTPTRRWRSRSRHRAKRSGHPCGPGQIRRGLIFRLCSNFEKQHERAADSSVALVETLTMIAARRQGRPTIRRCSRT